MSAALKGRKLSPEHVAALTTHGRKHDPNYTRWLTMMGRCHNEDHPWYGYYGARGIRVHESWHDVGTYCDWIAENLGPCPKGYSIDRIDNDGNYEPGNVRWASASDQVRNRRKIMVDLVCEHCGADFQSVRRNVRFCRDLCRYRYWGQVKLDAQARASGQTSGG